jgi:tRNA(Arg) A34 adenosine deaminase TadA
MSNPPGRFAITAEISLPIWLTDKTLPDTLDDRAAMALALELARENVVRAHGGPFGALLREDKSQKLLSVGINLVRPAANPALHAEIVAISLGGRSCMEGGGGVTLFSSCEPCIMCLGAAHWAGVRRVVFGAMKADAEAVGFKEGAGVPELKAEMKSRGIMFEEGVMREEAAAIFKEWQTRGGKVYGP